LIPHTGAETTLLHRKPGDVVNLENDIVGKYVERFLAMPASEPEQQKQSGIDLDFLAGNGFL
ncbi:MAG: riboflavin synthase, partial [Lachnospiraceae bacterium]|nr:riboflavin synthase [Lachnospiraceae bacterium]